MPKTGGAQDWLNPSCHKRPWLWRKTVCDGSGFGELYGMEIEGKNGSVFITNGIQVISLKLVL
jgi:hypothetical protein